MPLNMPANLTATKNQLSQPGAWVWLLTVKLTDGTILRYVANTEAVVYGGNTYLPFNFAIDSFVCGTDGELPELSMLITNIGYAIQGHMRPQNGLIGATFGFVSVNTEHLAEDWSEDEVTLTVTGAQNRWPDIEFPLSVPPFLRYRVPEDRLNPYFCRHGLRTPSGEYTSRCGYAGKNIAAVTLTSGVAVSIQCSAHGFVTGDKVRIYVVVGITGLDGDYTVTVTGPNTFTLDNTDGADYSGAFTSGKAGHAHCSRIPAGCIALGRFPGNYGGPLSLRKEAVRYA